MTAPFLGTNQVGSFPAAGTRPRQTKNVIFTTSGFWTVPPNVYTISITMAGGGGGGGGGGGYAYDGGTTVFAPSSGGGGGAAATIAMIRKIDVIPNTTFLITVGAGGAGGSAGTCIFTNDGLGVPAGNGASGTSGGLTQIDGYKYSFFVSGSGGGGGGNAAAGNIDVGGGTAGTAPTVLNITSSYASLYQFIYLAGAAGGAGGPNDRSGAGSGTARGLPGGNIQYTQGGIGGITPGVSINNWRGGGGGGGGANLLSRGGSGGAGAFSSITISTNVTASAAGQSPANLFTGYLGYGAGGGGGGGGSGYYFFASSFRSGSAGANGGSGFVEITWEE